jgi:hypothetical protein
MRLAFATALAALAVLGVGCGDAGSDTGSGPEPAPTAPAGAIAIGCRSPDAGVETLRATAVSCGVARRVLGEWLGEASCAGSPGASHAACSVAAYRCIGARADRGLSVSCSRPGQAVAFIARGD